MGKDFKLYATLIKALGDETRIKIFATLTQGERCACKILDELTISQSTLSYHMKILCGSGLVKGRRDGIWIRYTIEAEVLESLRGLFDELAASNAEPSRSCNCKGE